MIIKDMFERSIERDIKGVIKVAQTEEKHIYQELDEFVVTRELKGHMSKFYDNYQKSVDGTTDKMGVWISGFFGSGKSHFLKILAYLLENKLVHDEDGNGKQAINFFNDKIDDPLVLANMQRTTNVDTEVILFNIDSKGALGNKTKDDAILRVFLKVFNEHRGYYGDDYGVAEMEKYLDEQGLFDAFKEEFQILSGDPWIKRRDTFYFDQDYVIGALTKAASMTVESARLWIEKGIEKYEVSIEKFAKEVKAYLDKKGDNSQLVFLVDEIGQYVGDNTNLMLNLQTVAEDLGTHCQGRVWIIVTSQESIDSVVKVKGDDFSRIQGRFDTRLSLSSISVDEVLKHRILQKKDYVTDKLKLIYPEKSAILKNVISFRDCTADLRGYNNEQEFAEVYPFIPYQFNLLQKVFEQIRKHGSSGKSLSEGERSMLSAYKETALKYKDQEEGFLIPFYSFYDTIKEFLNPVVSRVIDGAYENPALQGDEFNMDLLKVLFMIKYIKELPANMDNIATLMITHIDEDKLELKSKIEVALRKLIAQTLIQKNGEYYIFLTDEEQDINREIKNMKIDQDKVKRELYTDIFQGLYDDKRVNYSKDYSFGFNHKMDEKTYGNQSASLGINVLSPLSEHYDKSDQELMMMTQGTTEMIMKLGGTDDYIEEMEESLKISEYRSKTNISQLPENMQNILNNKGAEATDRKRRVKNQLESAIKEATFFINGSVSIIKGSTVKEKITSALRLLVDNVYTKMGYINEHLEHERDIIRILSSDNTQVSMDTALKTDPNALAIDEINNFINVQDSMKKQMTVKTLTDRYSEKPYGWRELDIQGLIARLLKEQVIQIRYNAVYLDPVDDAQKLMSGLTKTAEAAKTIILKRTITDPKLLRIAKDVAKDIFNKTAVPDDEDGLKDEIEKLIEAQVTEITAYKNRYEGRKYPGMSLLDKGIEYFSQFTKSMDNHSFFKKLEELEEDLDYWTRNIRVVKSFFDTDQQSIFDQGLAGLKEYEDNKVYLYKPEVVTAMDDLKKIVTDPNPYLMIKDIPEKLYVLTGEIQVILKDKIDEATAKINEDYEVLVELAKQYYVTEDTRKLVETHYEDVLTNISLLVDIHRVDATIAQSTSFRKRMEGTIQREIIEAQRRKQRDLETRDGGITTAPPEIMPTRPQQVVKLSTLVAEDTLETEEEVDLYISLLSEKLKEIIRTEKSIKFIQ